MIKFIDVRFDPEHGHASKLPGLPAAAVWSCDTLQTLVLIGYLASPPKFQGLGLVNYWAWLRYAPAIRRAGTELKLRRIWGALDPHQKTILADDFGMGFPCHYLVDLHGFEDFADTNYLLEHLLSGVVSHASLPKRGPAKAPDFIAVDSLGRLHVLECKGTQKSQAHLRFAMGNGVTQKNNLSNSSLFCSSMVGGIYVPQFRSKEKAEIVFVDPEAANLAKALGRYDAESIARAIRRISLAKNLAAAGLVHLAAAVMGGAVKSVEPEFLRSPERNELEFAGYQRTDDKFWQRIVEYRSYETDDGGAAILRPIVTKMTSRVPDSLVTFFRESLSQRYGLPTEVVDEWIMSTQRSRRMKRVVLAEARAESGTNELKRSEQAVLSAWTPISVDATRSPRGWATAMGFEFVVESDSYF